MGKGDKRSFKGKLFMGSFGKSRGHKNRKNIHVKPQTPIPIISLVLDVNNTFRGDCFINGLTDVRNFIANTHLAHAVINIHFNSTEILQYEAIVDLISNDNRSPRIRPGVDINGQNRNSIREGINRLLLLNPTLQHYRFTINNLNNFSIEPIIPSN